MFWKTGYSKWISNKHSLKIGWGNLKGKIVNMGNPSKSTSAFAHCQKGFVSFFLIIAYYFIQFEKIIFLFFMKLEEDCSTFWRAIYNLTYKNSITLINVKKQRFYLLFFIYLLLFLRRPIKIISRVTLWDLFYCNVAQPQAKMWPAKKNV